MKIKTAYFELTNQCNLNCQTCYNRSGLNKMRIEISKQQLEVCIETLIKLGCNRILFAGGEPTLHSEFDEILDLVEKYSDISFGIVTNATVPNQKLINLTKTKDNFTIQISLDGSCEEENSKTRGKGSFTKTEKFIDTMMDTLRKPLIKMVVSQNNISDVESFYHFAVAKGGIPEYAFVNKQGNGSDSWDNMALTAKQKVSVLRIIGKLNIELNTEAFLPLCTSKCPLSNDLDNLSVVVRVDGTIVPCQLLYDDFFVLGNLFEFDLDNFSKRLNEISNLVKQREQTDYGCTKCILKEHCKKGCMALAYHHSKDPLATDGECEYRKLQFVGFQMTDTIRSLVK